MQPFITSIAQSLPTTIGTVQFNKTTKGLSHHLLLIPILTAVLPGLYTHSQL